MKNPSSSKDLQSRDTGYASGLDADFGCFWSVLVSALCPAGQDRDTDVHGARDSWFSPPWAQDTSVSYQGQSTAVGEDTYASAMLTMNMTDLGFLSIATGTSELLAVARSDPGEAVYTDVSDMFVPDDADIVLQTTTIVQGNWSDETGEWSASTSTTWFFAIDIAWIDLRKEWTMQTRVYEDDMRTTIAPGNIAYASADVTASGGQTITDFAADVLTVEDTISSAALTGFAGVFG